MGHSARQDERDFSGLKEKTQLVSRLLNISRITALNTNITKYAILEQRSGDGQTVFTVEE